MEIRDAKFIISLPAYGSFPGKGLPQLAVAGKSNVGKSSLINSLTGRKALAKTSGTPGKTRLINVFQINNAFHLIDLPGYGYAKVNKQEKEKWGEMMDGYFQKSDSLRLLLQLVDIRHEPTKDDCMMVSFLRQTGIPFVVVATKADKLSRAQRQRAMLLISRTLLVQPWEIIAYSSQTGEGRSTLTAKIAEALQDCERT